MNHLHNSLQAYGSKLLQEWQCSLTPLFTMEDEEIDITCPELDGLNEVVEQFECEVQSLLILADQLNSNSFAPAESLAPTLREEPAHLSNEARSNRKGAVLRPQGYDQNHPSFPLGTVFPLNTSKGDGFKETGSIAVPSKYTDSNSKEELSFLAQPPNTASREQKQEPTKALPAEKHRQLSLTKVSQPLKDSNNPRLPSLKQQIVREGKQEGASSTPELGKSKIPTQNLLPVLEPSQPKKEDGLKEINSIEASPHGTSADSSNSQGLSSLAQALKSGVNWNWSDTQDTPSTSSFVQKQETAEKHLTKNGQQSSQVTVDTPGAQPALPYSARTLTPSILQLQKRKSEKKKANLETTGAQKPTSSVEKRLSQEAPFIPDQGLVGEIPAQSRSFSQKSAQSKATALPDTHEASSPSFASKHLLGLKDNHDTAHLKSDRAINDLDKNELLDHLTEVIERDYQRFYGETSCP